MNLILLQLGGELRKLFARKRTYIGFGAFLVVELAVLGLLQLPKPKAALRRLIEGSGYVFEQYFAGLTLGLMILMWTTLLLGGLYLALVSGDVVSKDVEDGTMRMMLCRPVTRTRIALLKFSACFLYTFALIGFVGASALLAGVLTHGLGGLFVIAPMEKVFALYPPGEGLLRYCAGVGLLALSLLSITSLGFMLSCFNMKPAAATIVTLSVFFLDTIVRNIPYLSSLEPYFITTHMSAWIQIFVEYVPWTRLVQDYAYLFAVNFTLVMAGLWSFSRRDFKA